MAIDNRSKRASAAFPLLVFVKSGPSPDGSLTQYDRRHIIHMYSQAVTGGGGGGSPVKPFYPFYRRRRWL